jgi:hypothetical protein
VVTGVAACAPAIEGTTIPKTAAAETPPPPPPPAESARAPDPPPPPTDDCPHGTLAACAASCNAHVDRACDELGQRTCTEGSVLECRAACDGDNDAACRALGELYERGNRVAQSDEAALEIYDRACKKGRRWGCTSAGDLLVSHERSYWYMLGRERSEPSYAGPPGGLARAISYYDEGCDRVDPAAGSWIRWKWGAANGNACAQLVYAAPERVLSAFEARCAEPPIADRDHYWRDRTDPCSIVVESDAAPRAAKVFAMQRICARDPQSDACGRLKDLAAPGGGAGDGGAP